MFKSGEKEALIEDVEKVLTDNEAQVNELNSRLQDIEKVIKGFDEALSHMLGNPDYEVR